MDTCCCPGVSIANLVHVIRCSRFWPCLQVFRAQFGVQKELVALKIGAAALHEVGPVLSKQSCFHIAQYCNMLLKQLRVKLEDCTTVVQVCSSATLVSQRGCQVRHSAVMGACMWSCGH